MSPRRSQLERSMEQFLDEKSKRGGSGNYRRNAGRVLEEFIAFLEDGCPTYEQEQVPEAYRGEPPHEPVTRWSELNVEHCAAYARYLRDEVWADEIAGSTAHTYYAYVRAWGKWAVEEELLSENPAEKKRATKQLPDENPRSATQQMWSPEQRRAVLEAARERAQKTFDEDSESHAALLAARDRALVAVLSWSGVRGGEILADPNDERRDGARWDDLAWPADDHPDGVRVSDQPEVGTLGVLGKSGEVEPATVLAQAFPALRSWYRLLDPPSQEWPLFPTFDRPTLYELLDDVDDVDEPIAAVREQELVPPASTTRTGRRVMRRLTDDTGVELDGDASYLQPHGGRRGLGDELYRENPRLAQDTLRHEDIATTQEAYRERETAVDAAEASEIVDE